MAGIVVIFLCHIRSALVVLAGTAVVYSIVLAAQRNLQIVLKLACFVAACGFCSFILVESLGGQATLDRFGTLVGDNPITVYEKSARLSMVTNTFDELLIDHPLGAGLGRWGMMRAYFGNENNRDSPSIWAEVQFQAWALDGGIVLLSLYLIALAIAVLRMLPLSFLHRSAQLRQLGPVIIMLSAAPIAFMFSYTPFNSQLGMQFWLLIGAFEGLARGEQEIRSQETGEIPASFGATNPSANTFDHV